MMNINTLTEYQHRYGAHKSLRWDLVIENEYTVGILHLGYSLWLYYEDTDTSSKGTDGPDDRDI